MPPQGWPRACATRAHRNSCRLQERPSTLGSSRVWACRCGCCCFSGQGPLWWRMPPQGWPWACGRRAHRNSGRLYESPSLPGQGKGGVPLRLGAVVVVAEAPAGLAMGLRQESTQEQRQASGASFHAGQLKGGARRCGCGAPCRRGGRCSRMALPMGLSNESAQEQRHALWESFRPGQLKGWGPPLLFSGPGPSWWPMPPQGWPWAYGRRAHRNSGRLDESPSLPGSSRGAWPGPAAGLLPAVNRRRWRQACGWCRNRRCRRLLVASGHIREAIGLQALLQR